mmetsp:Transcript_139329/g.347348  ORF Transcript_139329/g.347348 Transcript_139329/m.347348 type:complete len:207 (+) Transcript_139329:1884-2504(+)
MEQVRRHFHAVQMDVELVEAVIGIPARHVYRVGHVHTRRLHVGLSCAVRENSDLIVGADRTDNHPRPRLHPIVDFLRVILPGRRIALHLVVRVDRILHHQVDGCPRQHLERWSQDPLHAITAKSVGAERRVGCAFHRLDVTREERDVLIGDLVRRVEIGIRPRLRCLDQLGVLDFEVPQLGLQVIVCISTFALRRVAIGNVAGPLH